MAKKNIIEKKFNSIRYRAICDDDTFKGRWRETVEEAQLDAMSHREKLENQFHIMHIITEETRSSKLD